MKNLTIILLSILLLLSLNSCIENTEEIVVGEDGTTTIKITYKGKASEIEGLALPSEPKWTIIADQMYANNDEKELTAEITVPYGEALPSTYATTDDAKDNLQLNFPSEVKYWTEGNRTYYEFKRTYSARRFQCFDLPTYLSHTDLWDQELENRVLEKGIFNVSETDRDEYLDQITYAYAFLHWRYLWETTAELAFDKSITLEQKEIVDKQDEYLEQELTNERFLDILSKDEDSIGIELDKFTEKLHRGFYDKFVITVGADKKTLHEKYKEIFNRVKLEYDITKKLDSHDFAVGVKLPGTIIKTNGLIDYEKPGVAEWAFNGNELHDKNLPLYVLSVVEK